MFPEIRLRRSLKPFAGAVAGRIADVSAQPDIGAAPSPLTFLPDYLTAEMPQTQAEIGRPDPAETRGFATLKNAGDTGLRSGEVRIARDAYLVSAQAGGG